MQLFHILYSNASKKYFHDIVHNKMLNWGTWESKANFRNI